MLRTLTDIKWFVDHVGNEGLYRMLADHEDKSAYCQCVLAFSAGPGAEPLLWVGKTHGTIVQPSGDAGFGWDACFVPDGKGMPFGAMQLAEKNEISHRARALAQFVEHVRQNETAVLSEMRDRGVTML